MDTRWARLSALFDEAMERDPRERLSFVRASSAGDPEIAREVEAMLAEIDRPQFIDRPAVDAVADLLASDTLIGSQVGPYRIESLLGAGGMGEVYRATDTVLGRQVAFKMLPAALAQDPERLARFHREARLLAALNHPNIAAIYGAEALPGQGAHIQALVLEIVEGPTLADRLASGPLPVEEVVGIARQLVDALEAAHRQGIVHRDLKPSNVKISHDGIVKVLDFGLAKLTQRDGDGSAGDTTVSPTITAPHLVTGAGVLLGTAAYMSPEQARAREADHRSDVWAFGCVVFEMLTGRRAFDGEDPIEVMGAIVRIEPNWSELPPDVPAPLRTLLEGCLVKDRRRRIGDISTAGFVLDHLATLASRPAVPAAPAPTHPARPYVLAALTVATLLSAATAIAVWWWTRPVAPAVTRFSISPTGEAAVNIDPVGADLAILPDGRHIAYVARGSVRTSGRLLIRSLDQLEPKAIVTIGTPRAPFVSADGKSVGYVSLGGGSPALIVVPLAGGAALELCRLDGQSRGVTWGDGGQVIFASSNAATGLQRVSASGGTPEHLTTPDVSKGEGDHVWPQFLPGARAVIFTIVPLQGGVDASQLWLLDLSTGNKKLILDGGSQAQYVASGHLVYARRGALHAVRFDLTRLEAVGQSIEVVDGIAILPTGTAEFAVSPNGTLIFIPPVEPEDQARTMVLVDRRGREEPVDGAPARVSTFPRLSPTGQQIVFDSREDNSDIWLFDRERRTTKQLTFEPGIDRTPIWTPKGDRIIYTSQQTSMALAYGVPVSRAVDGTGMALPLVEAPEARALAATSISPDGSHVVASGVGGVDRTNDLLVIDTRTRRVVPILPNASTDRNAEISPDGRWLAFESDREGGRFGVYVVPFPDVGRALYRISDGAGGLQPAWAPNGKELFYVGLDRTMRSVPVDGVNWPAGPPQRLFTANYFLGLGVAGRAYDVSRDGRFLMLKEAVPSDSVAPASIVVTQNWTEELKRLASD
jgi:Tol biopolymer transport system component